MLTEGKIAALKGAMLELADQEDEALRPELANNLRLIAEDPADLRRFAGLLERHETAADALGALTQNNEGRVELPLAEARAFGLDPSRHLRDGRHETPGPLPGDDMLVD
jgi:hypothetical protein